MATQAVNEIEAQFAHLPAEEQRALLERLFHQVRSAPAGNGQIPASVAPAENAGPRFRREWDSVNVDFRASENDLLSEV